MGSFTSSKYIWTQYVEDVLWYKVATVLVLAAILPVASRLAKWVSAQTLFNRVLSTVINRFLCTYYPVRNIDTGAELPTCPYVWPNGQGDVSKFLEGLESRNLWSSKYGNVYRIWSGMNPEIVVSRPDHVQEVFHDSDKHFKAPNNNSGYFLGQLLGKCLGLISGENWKTLKTSVVEPFLHVRMKDHIEIVLTRTEDFLKSGELSEKLNEGVIDPVEDFKMLPFWIVSEMLFGRLDDGQVQTLERLACNREELFKHAIAGGLTRFSISKLLPLQSIRDLQRFKREWAAFNHDAHKKLQSTGRSGAITQMWEAVDNGQITAEELLQTLDEMLFANLDVTMGSMSWNLVLLAENESAQDKLRAELEQSAGPVSADNPRFGAFLLSSSSYLAACVLEAARLQPLAAFSVPQSAPTDRVLDGFLIPARTAYIVDTYALNIKSEFWGDDASAYRPERFVGQSGSSIRYNYWRFGFGPRQCIGKYMADLIVRCLMANLIGEWKLSVPEKHEEWQRVKGTWINHPAGKLKAEKCS